MDVNVNGVLHTAQAAGRQMARFGNGGSIILIASMSGSITNMVRAHPLRPTPRALTDALRSTKNGSLTTLPSLQ